jgi:shikimate kinase
MPLNKFPSGLRPMKIFLIGFMGSGKSFWGRRLSEKLRMPFFDLDDQIEEHSGKPITDLFREKGEEHFRLLEKDLLHIITESHDSFVMACGGGTPCFYNNLDYMKQAGTVVWINLSPDQLFERLRKEKEHRPLIRDLSDEQLRSFILRKFADRKMYYDQADVHADEEPLDLDDLIQRIFHA